MLGFYLYTADWAGVFFQLNPFFYAVLMEEMSAVGELCDPIKLFTKLLLLLTITNSTTFIITLTLKTHSLSTIRNIFSSLSGHYQFSKTNRARLKYNIQHNFSSFMILLLILPIYILILIRHIKINLSIHDYPTTKTIHYL